MTTTDQRGPPSNPKEKPPRRPSLLPPSLPPRGLSREQAAEYIGVSATKFDEMVADGRMPRPKEIDARRSWDRHRLDAAYAALPDAKPSGGHRQPDAADGFPQPRL